MSHKTPKYDIRIEDEDAIAIHIGYNAAELRRRFAEGEHILPKYWAWAWDGEGRDSWDEWGEAPGPGEQGRHIIILTLHAEEMTNALADSYGHLLVPLSDASGAHVVWSEPHNWSGQTETFVIDENFRLDVEEEW